MNELKMESSWHRDHRTAGGAHYHGEVQPWDLRRCMKSTGNAHLDGLRCEIIAYAFRIKELKSDLHKIKHLAEEAIRTYEDSNTDS